MKSNYLKKHIEAFHCYDLFNTSNNSKGISGIVSEDPIGFNVNNFLNI